MVCFLMVREMKMDKTNRTLWFVYSAQTKSKNIPTAVLTVVFVVLSSLRQIWFVLTREMKKPFFLVILLSDDSSGARKEPQKNIP